MLDRDANKEKLKAIWNSQNSIPVILRRTGKAEKLRVKLPLAQDNLLWLRNGQRTIPQWTPPIGGNPGYWELPKAWFNELVERCLDKYKTLYIVQPFREMEICSPACQNAVGHECQCSCMGANHGSGNDGSWFEVSDTFAVRWKDGDIACRLLTRKPKRSK